MTAVIVYEGSSPEGASTIFATRKAAVGFSGQTRYIVPHILHFDYLEEHMTGQRLVAVPAVTQHLTADVLADAELSQAARDVLAERQRQITAEGWMPEHDDGHNNGELADAAGCYALIASIPDELRPRSVPMFWPLTWHRSWWKPSDRRRDLVKAGALILAELERLDRIDAARANGGA